jgi:phage terminase large subunit
MKLNWAPQEAFADFFELDPDKIVDNRSVFNSKYNYFIAYGGRGSAKTWTFSDAFVVEGTLRPMRILVTRELQNSIENSIKTEIETAIAKRGLGGFYKILKNEIVGLNGTKFIFKGLKNNILSIKSIAHVDGVLAEESQNISKESWDVFLPSIRPLNGRTPIRVIIFNPDDELDDTWQRFIVNPPPGAISRLINWRDNIYFPQHLDEERRHFKATRPRRDYENIWEGKPRGNYEDCIIDREWIRAARWASKRPGFTKIGPRVAAYDPAGQGRDYNAVVSVDGNVLDYAQEWLKSPDLREATRIAMGAAKDLGAGGFRYDECGGFGDGVSVFVEDIINGKDEKMNAFSIEVTPFNAGDPVVDPDEAIPGTNLTNGEMYANAKAQAHAVTAQKFYNTYRFAVLGESVDPADMLSVDIADDAVFNKLVKELSTPIWVKSGVNSKKKVESKADMEKRTKQPSPNIADALHMCLAPKEVSRSFFDAFLNKRSIP